MQTRKELKRLGIPAILLSLVMCFTAVAAGQNRTVVHPEDTGAILVNPGMGWVFHHYDNSIDSYGSRLEPWDTVDDFPGVGVIYLRLAWEHIEPEEGQFNWSIVDIPAQRWIPKGKQIAFRFSCDDGNRGRTPEWVRRAGAHVDYQGQGVMVEKSATWVPDYDDPIFLKKLENFLAAAAQRYDGDPNVAFIDVGSFGIWGEGEGAPHPYSAKTVRTHINLHTKHFKRTLLVLSDNYSYQGKGGEKLLLYARDQGLTYRDDSILVRGKEDAYFNPHFAGHFWRTVPIILESCHYGHRVKTGSWGDGSLYLQAVEDMRGSYVSVHWWPREFFEGNRDLVRRISMRMGYRLQLTEASFPAEVPASGSMRLSYEMRNAGVAPCLPGGHLCLTLKDERGGIVGVFVDEGFDMRSLPVGPPQQADSVARKTTFRFQVASVLKPGSYHVYISVGSSIGTPRIALPLADEDGQRRYRIGSMRVLNQGTTADEETAMGEETTIIEAAKTDSAFAAQQAARLAASASAKRLLIKQALDIGDGGSLPWADPKGWNAPLPGYDLERLADDTLAVLTPATPLLVRMETLRRAVVYSQQDTSLADQVHARLLRRVRLASLRGKAEPLAEFDLGYFVGALQQADWLDRCIFEDPNGYALVRSALQLAGSSAEMEFAAALMVAEPAGQWWFWHHLEAAAHRATEGSLLTRNLLIVFRDQGKTLDELIEYARR